MLRLGLGQMGWWTTVRCSTAGRSILVIDPALEGQHGGDCARVLLVGDKVRVATVVGTAAVSVVYNQKEKYGKMGRD